jgi:hypothetical protein
MKVVEEERNRVKIHLLSKHKSDIDAANVHDKKVSKELKMQKYVEQARKQICTIDISNKHHFNIIMDICESDPDNKISKKIISYMEKNNLIV